MELTDRINKIMETNKARSIRDFANMINVKEVTLTKQLNGERAISLDTIVSILSAFPDISSEWLIRGEGEMIKRNGVLSEPNATYNVLDFVIACKDSSAEELDAAEQMIESIKVLQHKKYKL